MNINQKIQKLFPYLNVSNKPVLRSPCIDINVNVKFVFGIIKIDYEHNKYMLAPCYDIGQDHIYEIGTWVSPIIMVNKHDDTGNYELSSMFVENPIIGDQNDIINGVNTIDEDDLMIIASDTNQKILGYHTDSSLLIYPATGEYSKYIDNTSLVEMRDGLTKWHYGEYEKLGNHLLMTSMFNSFYIPETDCEDDIFMVTLNLNSFFASDGTYYVLTEDKYIEYKLNGICKEDDLYEHYYGDSEDGYCY